MVVTLHKQFEQLTAHEPTNKNPLDKLTPIEKQMSDLKAQYNDLKGRVETLERDNKCREAWSLFSSMAEEFFRRAKVDRKQLIKDAKRAIKTEQPRSDLLEGVLAKFQSIPLDEHDILCFSLVSHNRNADAHPSKLTVTAEHAQNLLPYVDPALLSRDAHIVIPSEDVSVALSHLTAFHRSLPKKATAVYSRKKN